MEITHGLENCRYECPVIVNKYPGVQTKSEKRVEERVFMYKLENNPPQVDSVLWAQVW